MDEDDYQNPKEVLIPSIGFLNLAIIIFSNVGSGPAGIEGLIGAAGISNALIGIIVFPFFWGYLQALFSLELSVKYKKLNGGVGTWVSKLFGPSLGFCASIWVLCIQCSTAAFVSEVTVSYIQAYSPNSLQGYWQQQGMTFAIIVGSFSINAVSIDFTSKTFWIFSLNAVLAFAVLCGFSIPKVDSARFTSPVSTGKNIKWSQFINLLVYNSAGYDSSSSVVKYVVDPRRMIPKAMLAVGAAITVIYILAITLPYLATRDSQSDWQSGHFVVAARGVGPAWLEVWILISCVLTNLQIYTAALQCASYNMAAMAEVGIFPKGLAKTVWNIPYRSMVLCAVISVAFGFVPLLINLSVESIFYVAVILAEGFCFLVMDSHTMVWSPKKLVWRKVIVMPLFALAMYTLTVQNYIVSFVTYTVIMFFFVSSVKTTTTDQLLEELVERKQELDVKPADYYLKDIHL
jgi:amino acid transporter